MNTDNNIYLNPSPTNEQGIYLAFKKVRERLGWTICLPVARISLNPSLDVDFYQVPALPEEEKNFIEIEAKKLTA